MKLFAVFLLFISSLGFSDSYIVVLDDGQNVDEFTDFWNLSIVDQFESINGFSVEDSQNLEAIAEKPGVSYIEKDKQFTVPNTPTVEQNLMSQKTPWGVKRVGNFDCSSCPRAWIFDTGIDLNHPDLNVETKYAFSMFGDSADDDNGHGTHVAGIVGAKDNDIGVVGVAAGARLVPVKVMNSRGSGSTSGIIKGIDHMMRRASKGDVANMSLGGSESKSLDSAVKSAADRGIKFTVAAGNDGENAKTSSPARVEHKNVFTISAFDKRDYFARFSNYGSVVDKSEPGVSILSTMPSGRYATKSGTSMASPHAAGILLKSGRFSRSCKRVKRDPDSYPDCIGMLP